MGILTQNDAKLYRDYFKEMAKLRGIHAYYKYVINSEFTIHAEMIDQKYSDSLDTYIIFESNPKVSTLRKLGWISELPEDKPYIATVAYDLPSLKKGSIFIIPPPIELQDSTEGKAFKVTDISAIIEFPDSWICKLAPIFDTNIPKSDYSSNNFNYINDGDPNGN